jgi:hypothetical protein
VRSPARRAGLARAPGRRKHDDAIPGTLDDAIPDRAAAAFGTDD